MFGNRTGGLSLGALSDSLRKSHAASPSTFPKSQALTLGAGRFLLSLFNLALRRLIADFWVRFQHYKKVIHKIIYVH